MSHLKITQAGIVAALTTVVGWVVAFVPNLAAYQSDLIAAGSAGVAFAFLVANAVHHLADAQVSVSDLKDGVVAQVHSEVSKIDFNTLVKSAVDARNISSVETIVQQKIQQELQRIFTPVTTPAPPA